MIKFLKIKIEIILIIILFFLFLSFIFNNNGGSVTKKKPIKNEKYYVELSPVGKVWLKQIPDKIITMDDNYNDMLIALNEEHKLIATGFPNNMYWGFYKSIGIIPNIDKSKLVYLGTRRRFFL